MEEPTIRHESDEEELDLSPTNLVIAHDEEVITISTSPGSESATPEPDDPVIHNLSLDSNAIDRFPGLYHLWKQPCNNGTTAVEFLNRLHKEQIKIQNNQNVMLASRLLNNLSCEICSRKFAKHSHLKRHMTIHSSENNKEQEEFIGKMDQGYILGSQSKLHQALSKYFECEICDKKFAQASTLKNHMFTHTKEKPHACPSCGKRFSLGGDLRRHILIHTGEKPYACDLCGKRSSRLDNLKKHQQTHRREGITA